MLSIIVGPGEFFYFDCATRVTPGREVRVTSHPVEEGADPSDHAQAGPATWDVVASVAEGSGNPHTPIDVYQLLDGIALRGQPITVDIPRLGRSFGNVVLESYSCPIDTRLAFEFTMRLREIRRAVVTQTVIPPDQPVPAAGDLSDGTDGGKQGTEVADDATDARSKSIAASLYDLALGR